MILSDLERLVSKSLKLGSITQNLKNENKELKKENKLLLEQVKSLNKTRLLTVDLKVSEFEEIKELLKVLDFYATTPRSGLHEDGGNLARKALEKFTNLN